MKAMMLHSVVDLNMDPQPLKMGELPIPEPGSGELLIKVYTCGVCHTELDEIEGRTPPPIFPVVPGHQVVGRIEKMGEGSTKYRIGDRVGVAWIFSSCGRCDYCLGGSENLCEDFKATGRDAHGGYAEYLVAREDYVHPIPGVFSDEEAAPLLCAGAIGYRSLKLTTLPYFPDNDGTNSPGDGGHKTYRLGLTGFGASAHLVLKMARYLKPEWPVYVFARNDNEREFALKLGASWAGDTADRCPEKLDAVIDTTPVWKPPVEALLNLKPEGRLVINAIRKENVDTEYLLQINYAKHLWMEKEIKSVANVAVTDVRGFLKLAAEMSLRPEYQLFSLEEANIALMELKHRKILGAKVLKVSG